MHGIWTTGDAGADVRVQQVNGLCQGLRGKGWGDFRGSWNIQVQLITHYFQPAAGDNEVYFPDPIIGFKQLEHAPGENGATGAGHTEDHTFGEGRFRGEHQRDVSECLPGSQESVRPGSDLICEEAPTGRPSKAQANRPGLTDCLPRRALKGRSTDPAVPPHRSRWKCCWEGGGGNG